MLKKKLQVEHVIGIQKVHRYVPTKANSYNKYIKNYDKNKESSCVQYLDANNLYGWAMSQKLPVNGFQ